MLPSLAACVSPTITKTIPPYKPRAAILLVLWLINNFHPGRASYVEILNMGHDFAAYPSQAEFLNRNKAFSTPHPYSGELVTTILNWLQQH